MSITITITTDTNPEGWGDECDPGTAQRAAERLAEMLAEYAREAWPEADVEAGTSYVCSGGSTRLVAVDGTDDYALIEEIGREIGAAANDWWTSALDWALDH